MPWRLRITIIALTLIGCLPSIGWATNSLSNTFPLEQRQESCDDGGWTLNVGNWRNHNTTQFLRQWWYCANGQLPETACQQTPNGLSPLSGDSGTTGDNKTGNLSLAITNKNESARVIFNIADYLIPGVNLLRNITGTNDTNTKNGTNSTNAANVTVIPRNPEARNGLMNALKYQYTPKLNGTKCTVLNDCLSDFGNCGNYHQDEPDALRAYYTMQSMANLNDMFVQMYRALDGAKAHMGIKMPTISEQFTQLGSPDRYLEWIFLEVVQNLMAAVSAIGIVIVPELGAAYFGERLFATGIQSTHYSGSLRNAEVERANRIIREMPGARETVFDAYKLSSYNTIREFHIELSGLGRSRTHEIRRTKVLDEIARHEQNIEDLQRAQNDPNAGIPLLLPDFYNLVVPKPTWRYRLVDACSKLVGLIPNVTGLFAIYFNKQVEQPDDKQWAQMGAIAYAVINSVKSSLQTQQEALFRGVRDAGGWFIWDYIADGNFALERDLTVYNRFSDSIIQILDWMAINVALKQDRNFIQGFTRHVGRNNSVYSCDRIKAIINGPWETFFCDDSIDEDYYYFMYRIPINDVFGGLFKHRLKLPNGIRRMGVSDRQAQDPAFPPDYNVTVQDIMNSSIIGWNLTRENRLSTFGSLSWTTWLNDISRSPNPASVRPVNFRGMFTLPVCMTPIDNKINNQLYGWPVNNALHKSYPCKCVDKNGVDFTQMFRNSAGFIDRDYAMICHDKFATSISSFDEAVIAADNVNWTRNAG